MQESSQAFLNCAKLAAMRKWMLLALLSALPLAGQIHGQTRGAPRNPHAASETAPLPELSPANALKYALAPYHDARHQPNDLTAQDQWALGISITRAMKLCNQITAKGLPASAPDLLALGRLCNFGIQYMPARDALVAYLGLPHPPDREAAYLLLGRVFLGLHQSAPAESEAESLMDDYPYSAATNALIDLIISHSEGRNPASMASFTVHRLTEEQLPFLLKALQAGEIPASDAKASPEHTPVDPQTAFYDALRCAWQFRIEQQPKKESALLATLSQIVASNRYAHSPELPAMQAALAAYRTLGQPLPVSILHGKTILSGHPLSLITLSLRNTTTILIPVTLWAPTSLLAVQTIAKSFHGLPVKIATVTSFAANTGSSDKPSAAILKAFEQMRQQFPPRIPLLILPDRELQKLTIADYPSAILIGRDGSIHFNHPLFTNGDLRLLIEAYKQQTAAPGSAIPHSLRPANTPASDSK
jgi:hypothetical protein